MKKEQKILAVQVDRAGSLVLVPPPATPGWKSMEEVFADNWAVAGMVSPVDGLTLFLLERELPPTSFSASPYPG